MLQAIVLSLELGACSALVCFLIALPLAYLFEGKKGILPMAAESFVVLPMVLPPTVLGFYCLLALAPDGFIGYPAQRLLGLRLAFSFPGILFASCVSSLPFMFRSLRSGLGGIPARLWEAAACLGKGRFVAYLRVILPSMPEAIVSGFLLCFAHAMGEFGVIVMVGGSIPGQTRTASIAIFEAAESLNFGRAGMASLALAGLSYLVLLCLRIASSGKNERSPAWN
jgi:molybdate transport system permease protein